MFYKLTNIAIQKLPQQNYAERKKSIRKDYTFVELLALFPNEGLMRSADGSIGRYRDTDGKGHLFYQWATPSVYYYSFEGLRVSERHYNSIEEALSAAFDIVEDVPRFYRKDIEIRILNSTRDTIKTYIRKGNDTLGL